MLTKVVAVLFALVALRRLVSRYRAGGTLSVDILFWGMVFGGIAVAAFFPGWTDTLAEWMGISGGFHALTFLSVSTLLLIVFRLIGKTKEIDRNLTILVRANALAMPRHVQAAGATRDAANPAARGRSECVGAGEPLSSKMLL